VRRAAALLATLALLAAPLGPASLAAPAAPALPAKPAAAAPDAKAPDSEADKPPPRKPPPYEAQLLRLAEMIGALAYLRDLCGAGDGAAFRARLAALIQADGIGEDTRNLVAGAYNDAYRGYGATYRTCTPAAKEIVGRFLTETERLATDVAARYGGG